jgi:Actinobacteria/chloroflexi VLRF1 release factor
MAAERYELPPERLGRWLERWAEEHGGVAERRTADALVTITARDGAVVECEPPFPPVRGDLLTHVARERTVGVLLVRLGGHAAGVFRGARLLDSKVGSRLVHGRHRAGGSSSGRFARRREGQAHVALRAAADVAVRVLRAPAAAGELDAIVLGGDRAALAKVLADTRLAAVRALAVDRVLEVGEPRLKVLQATPAAFTATIVRQRPISPGGCG